MRRRSSSLIGLIVLSSFGLGALAQDAGKMFDATIVGMDEGDRTITVRFDANDETGTYPVGEDAVLIRAGTGLTSEQPIAFSDFHVGDDISLEFGGIEGHETLNKILNRSKDS